MPSLVLNLPGEDRIGCAGSRMVHDTHDCCRAARVAEQGGASAPVIGGQVRYVEPEHELEGGTNDACDPPKDAAPNHHNP